MIEFAKLRTKKDFDFVINIGKKFVTKSLIVFACRENNSPKVVYNGIITSKKVGGAVARNRAKRRIREAIRIVFKEREFNIEKCVFIARKNVISCKFDNLVCEIKYAFKGINGINDKKYK